MGTAPRFPIDRSRYQFVGIGCHIVQEHIVDRLIDYAANQIVSTALKDNCCPVR